MESKDIVRGRLMYIFEAALEYLISILVTGSYLATITKELGLSDGLTGILSSIISLGCLFQLLSVFLRRRRVKRFVIFMSISNQVLFLMLYVIPLFEFSCNVKTVLFVVFIFLAYLIYNVTHPKKINWLMSLVDDHSRGIFTANKEIVSLISGIVFTYIMGAVVDYFSEKGNIRTAFILSAIVIFVLMVLHTLTMVLVPKLDAPLTPKKSIFKSIREVIGSKNIIHVMVVFVLYYISTYVSTPFYGTYLIRELSFSLKFVSVLSIVGSIVRIAVSRLWGVYADKKSFIDMIQKCLLVLGVGYLFATLAVPANGKAMFSLYYIFHGVAMGGVNGGLLNLIYDYVSIEKRADSLAVCQAASGLSGFLVSLIASMLVTYIQKNGNMLFGINIYAQQLVSGISVFIIIISLIYIKVVFVKSKEES